MGSVKPVKWMDRFASVAAIFMFVACGIFLSLHVVKNPPHTILGVGFILAFAIAILIGIVSHWQIAARGRSKVGASDSAVALSLICCGDAPVDSSIFGIGAGLALGLTLLIWSVDRSMLVAVKRKEG